MYSQKTVLL